MRHSAAPTRRQLRRRRLNRCQRVVSLLLLAGLAAGAAVPCVMLQPWTASAQTHARFDRSTALTRTDLVEASRSVEREAGVWTLGESDEPTGSLTVRAANNPVVKALINGRDADALPDGFDPDHATGDTGNAYAFSQCTWWAYVRRHQLGLPAGSHMGNGADWASTARKLGYWVDDSPRVGDVICFGRGQYDSDLTYGHVGIVENVGQDGSITTSECGAAYNGKPFSRTFTAEQAKQLQFIHY